MKQKLYLVTTFKVHHDVKRNHTKLIFKMNSPYFRGNEPPDRIHRLQSTGYEIQVKDTQLKMKNNLGSREEGDNPIFQLVIGSF